MLTLALSSLWLIDTDRLTLAALVAVETVAEAMLWRVVEGMI
jgi:hypothetical protein